MPFTFKLSKRLARLKAVLRATRLPAESLAAQAPTVLAVLQASNDTPYTSATVTASPDGIRRAGSALSRKRPS